MADRGMGRDVSQVPPALADAANVLVSAPSFRPGDDSDTVCSALLTGDDPSRTRVVAVTYTQTPERWLADWRRDTGAAPAEGLVIGVGGGGAGERAEASGEWRVERLPDAGNLTRLGVTLSEFIDGDDGRSTRLCFDSLTVLLQYAGVGRTFRFLHAVTSRVQQAGAVGHYHLDPAAHDDQTLATVRGLFDAVVDVDESGDWTVTTR